MMADADSTYLLLGLGLLGLGLVFLVLELFIPSGGLLTLLVIACVAASGVSIFLWDSTVGLAYVLLLIAIAPFSRSRSEVVVHISIRKTCNARSGIGRLRV